MKPLIFYVDDEPNNLIVFEAGLSDEWDVQTFDSPEKAIQALQTLSPCIIVSDQMMPSMKGAQFLQVAKEIKPEAIRMIVTGYSSDALTAEAQLKAQVFRFISKPWDLDDLETNLRQALETYKTNQLAKQH